MLDGVTIQNFRLFEQFSIDNLARVNLIVGKNNVGKSSLLEALYLMVNQNSPETLIKILEERGEYVFSGKTTRSRNYQINHIFPAHHLRDDISITIRSSSIEPLGVRLTYIKKANQLSFFPMNNSKIRHGLIRLEYLGTLQEISIEVSDDILNTDTTDFLVSNPFENRNIHFVTTKMVNYHELAKLWDNITLTSKEQDVIQILQIIEDKVDRISFQSRVTANNGVLVKYKNQNRPIPLGSMGDGMHHILAIAMNLANSENGYLFVDEIDTGLHYRTMTDMWRVIFQTAERLNIQVFATTHSADCINAFSEALTEEAHHHVGKLFRLERRGEQISAVDYDYQDLAIATSEEIEVR
ncbi:AAA family ATPase [Anaerolineales bacterium HSG6]|nr:AAA family ATPase [Anaerolineales bacterium HSG6]